MSMRPLPAALLMLACAGGNVMANDRPFQSARTAVMEDDEYVWSMENWVQRFGRVRGLSIEPEYTFGGGFSIQTEFTRLLDRDRAATGHEAEIEFKQIFNHVARDGWGIAVSAALSTGRSEDGGSVRGATFRVPLSLPFGNGGYLHLNLGVAKESDAKREWTRSFALEHDLFKRTTGFVEWARTGEETYAQVGVRHWVKKEKLAVDFSLQQFRREGRNASGFILGLGIYDF